MCYNVAAVTRLLGLEKEAMHSMENGTHEEN
jgi:hypothetical protein